MPYHRLAILLLFLPLGACGGRAGIGASHDGGPLLDSTVVADGVPADAAPPDVAGTPDGPLAAFCTGAFSRMAVNGIDSGPSVTGTMLPYDCCYGAEFVVVTQTFAQLIVVSWRAQVGQATLPATIDLANSPPGWGVQVAVGCDPAQSSCYPLPDSYTTGLTGTLQVSQTSSGAYDMSLCLSVAEPAGSPHPLVHSLELWAPHVPVG